MRLNRLQSAILAAVLTVAGAVLALALSNDDASAVGVRLKTLGVIFLVAGVVFLAIIYLAGVRGGGKGSDDEPAEPAVDAHLAGLIAVVAAIAGVCILAAITLTHFASEDKDSVVAVTTSAFGIISAVVGAYLGIKTAGTAHETAAKVAGDAKSAELKSTKHAQSLRAAIGNELSDEDRDKVLETAATIEGEL